VQSANAERLGSRHTCQPCSRTLRAASVSQGNIHTLSRQLVPSRPREARSPHACVNTWKGLAAPLSACHAFASIGSRVGLRSDLRLEGYTRIDNCSRSWQGRPPRDRHLRHKQRCQSEPGLTGAKPGIERGSMSSGSAASAGRCLLTIPNATTAARGARLARPDGNDVHAPSDVLRTFTFWPPGRRIDGKRMLQGLRYQHGYRALVKRSGQALVRHCTQSGYWSVVTQALTLA
jgi:hypothetical protein